MAETIKVLREGGRGWHLINRSDFDPDVHERFEVDAPGQPTKADICAALTEKDIEFDKRWSKARLVDLLEAAVAAEAAEENT